MLGTFSAEPDGGEALSCLDRDLVVVPEGRKDLQQKLARRFLVPILVPNWS